MIRNVARSFSPQIDRRVATSELTEKQSYKFVHLLGYAILGFMAIDYIALLVPPQFFNPNWELNTIGRIIETVWVTLIGLMLVFFRPNQQSIKQSELRILAFLSWLSLLLGIVCFLFAPLAISNSLRIDNTNKSQVNARLTTQSLQAEEITTRISQLNEAQINSLWQRNQSNNDSLSVTEKKQQLTQQVSSREQEGKQQLQNRLKSDRRSLLKTTFKWVLGTILSGLCFVSLWRYTEWTREFARAYKPKKKQRLKE